MTPLARREAVRIGLLLFREIEKRECFDQWSPDEPRQERVSHLALAAALSVLARQMPKRRELIARYMADWRSFAFTREQAEVDRTLDWLAARMPAWITIPNGTQWELRWTEPPDEDDEDGLPLPLYNERDIPDPPQHVAYELLAVCRAADAEHTNDDDDWSGPAPHAYVDPEGAILTAVYGEIQGEIRDDEPLGYHITKEKAPAEHGPGRPRRGSKEPERAKELLLELCPGRTIDELRAALARGRPSTAAKDTRPLVSAAIRRIRLEKLATPEALAEALRCSVATIYRHASS